MAKGMRSWVGVAARGVAVVVVLIALLAFERSARAQDYADAGTFAVDTSTADAGGTPVDVVVPEGAGPFPLIIASHGFSATNAQQLGWAQHFATWGFVVVAPSFPNSLSPDETVDSNIIEQLVSVYSSAATVSPAQGKVDATRIGLEGHSAGGLASTLAAKVIAPGALVLFDPVDDADAGQTAYATLCSPTLDVFADPSSCNNNEEWSTFATNTTAPLAMFRVVGSTHCDGENADRGALCGALCGGDASPTRQAVYARYATAFFLAKLNGDPTAAAALAETALAADTTISSAAVQSGTAGCVRLAVDGGVIETEDGSTPIGDPDPKPNPSPTASPTATSPTSSTPPPTNGASSSGTSEPASSSGCGCTLAGVSTTGSPFALVAAALVLARRRRRHARG
jgi:MYXO-CTERM domain-containing protein